MKATTLGVRRLPFLVGDDLDLAAFHDGDDGVGRAQVDADDFFFCHVLCSFLRPSVSEVAPGRSGSSAVKFACRLIASCYSIEFSDSNDSCRRAMVCQSLRRFNEQCCAIDDLRRSHRMSSGPYTVSDT